MTTLRILHFSAYFLWAAIASFALGTDSPGIAQALAILPVVLFYSCFPSQWMLHRVVKKKSFLLVCVGAFFACISAALNGCTDIGLTRYLALVPAFVVMIPSSEDQVKQRDAIHAFALAGLAFCIAHIGAIDPGRIFDPKFRIELFLNTNGVGFIAGMTLITHSVLLSVENATPKVPLRIYHWISIFFTSLILFLTRSRTATIACAAGVATMVIVKSYGKISVKKKLLILAGSVFVLVVWGQKIFSVISDYYSLFDKYRSVINATNRTDIWSYVLRDVIPNHFLIGVGPGLIGSLLEKDIGFFVTNNGFLMYLAEIGILGTLPYFVIFLASIKHALKNESMRNLVLPLLVAGGIESMGETMFFSTGNVGSLMFLFALIVAIHGRAKPEPLS